MNSIFPLDRGWLRLFFFVLLAPTAAWAHKLSDSYLTLRPGPTNVAVEWHLALRDLEDAIGLDSDENGEITWKEVQEHRTALGAYAFSHLHLAAAGRTTTPTEFSLLIDHHSDGAYAVLRFGLDGLDMSSGLDVEYRAFFEMDPSHRGLLRLEAGGGTQLAVFSPTSAKQHFVWINGAHHASFFAFVQEGIWHIWTGYDHLLFLLALLLPAVLRRGPRGWEPAPSQKSVWGKVFKIVTAFTVAHSLTLSLATLGWVQLPARLVESVIAASVGLVALNNIYGFFRERGWWVAFGFGLIHGFGFANALQDLGVVRAELAVTLLGFNMGVEFGQMVIVGLFLPIAYGVRSMQFYPRFILRWGSCAILVVAAVWFSERAFAGG